MTGKIRLNAESWGKGLEEEGEEGTFEHRPQPTRLLCPWDSPGKNTGVGCHFLLQGIVPTQGSNPGLPHCRTLKGETVPDSLPATPKSPPTRRVPSRGTPRVPAPLPLSLQCKTLQGGAFPLGLSDSICFQSKGLSRVFSITAIQKHQFFSAQLSV